GLLRLLQLRLFQPQRVQIFFRHSRKALISCNRIATPEALRDHALGSGRNGRLLATGNLDGLAITLQCEFSVFVHSVLSLLFRAKARNLWMFGTSEFSLVAGNSCRLTMP